MNIRVGVAIVAILALAAAAVSVYAPQSWQNLNFALRGNGASVVDASAFEGEPAFVLAQDAESGDEQADDKEEAGDGAGGDAEGSAEGDEAAEEGADAAAAADEAPATEGEAAEEAAAEGEVGEGEEDDAVTRFKNMDPRDIIEEKRKLADEKLTTPWDREDPETFIPETGRIDPLTRVRAAVPEDLAPPRSGETDENQFNTYLLSQQASNFIEGIGTVIQVHNVLQIGLEKLASVSIGGTRGTFGEGQGTQFMLGFVDNIPMVGSINCVSISADEVIIRVTVNGEGTDTSVSKDFYFIPN
jgi:hypothetical protein